MIKDFFKLSLLSIKHSKVRAWLTIIGIVIGIASIIALISISQGLENAIVEQFSKLGVQDIRVAPKGLRGPPTGTSFILTTDDVKNLEPEAGYIVVGKYKLTPGQGKWEGRIFHNFNVHGMISMKEIAEYTKEQKTQEEEIKEKVEEHSEAPGQHSQPLLENESRFSFRPLLWLRTAPSPVPVPGS